MRQMVWGLLSSLLMASAVSAATINGVAHITTAFNANNPGIGGTLLTNAGTKLDGLYGTENMGYLVDDFPGTLGYNDGLIIKATVEINDEGTTSGADNGATLGYSNPATGHRNETMFGLNFHAPNDGRIFALIGGAMVGPLGSWADSFGRNHPFDVDLTASLTGNSLSMVGTISDGVATINVNVSANVNPAGTIEAFGTSSAFHQPGTQRNFGADFSNVMYSSPIPEPSSAALAGVAMALAGAWRRRPQAG